MWSDPGGYQRRDFLCQPSLPSDLAGNDVIIILINSVES